MLGKLGAWRHVVVASSIVGVAVLAATGVIGRGPLPERFEAKVVTVTPSGADGVRIREVVDQDFGTKQRHGYERIIPTDFGNPTDIEASSPDANAAIDVTPVATGDRIRLGDPNTTYTGQHRYVLAYTLPDARMSTGQLALDIIGDPRKPEELRTDRFEVVVAGLNLDNPTCNVGKPGAIGGCTLARDGDVYRTVISPLEPGQGITIGGTITGRTQSPIRPIRRFPTRRPDHRAGAGPGGTSSGSARCMRCVLLGPTRRSQRGVRRWCCRRGLRRSAPTDERRAAGRRADGGRQQDGRTGHDRVRAAEGPRAVAGSRVAQREDRSHHRLGLGVGTRRQGGADPDRGRRRSRRAPRAPVRPTRRRHQSVGRSDARLMPTS